MRIQVEQTRKQAALAQRSRITSSILLTIDISQEAKEASVERRFESQSNRNFWRITECEWYCTAPAEYFAALTSNIRACSITYTKAG